MHGRFAAGHDAVGEIEILLVPRSSMKARQLDWITAAIDLAAAVAAPVFGAWLVEQFGEPRGVNAIWPLLGWCCFCGAIMLVRRLQPAGEPNPLAPDPSITKPASWVGMSAIVGTSLLLIAIAIVSGAGMGAVFEGGVVGFVLSLVVTAMLFAPLALLWVGEPEPIGEQRRTHAEIAVLVASDLAMLIMIAFFEFLMYSQNPELATQGPMPAIALIGLPIAIVAFLLMCGAPRLLLLTRSFSWVGAGSLVLSTGWYLISSFYNWV
jgi:hypothetical protein